MKADYSLDPFLYEKCLSLIDDCFPGIKALADKGRNHNAYWDKSSIPFVIKQEQEIIAHLGLLPFNFLIQGKFYHAAAIHGVCTKEPFRRRGYFRTLMLEAIKYIHQNYDFSFLFTDQPSLYEPFGFKVIKEQDFPYNASSQTVKKNKLRKLDLANPVELELMQNAYLNRIPLSNIFSIIKETTVATLNALHQPVYYIEELNVLIIYHIENDILYLKDIITTKLYGLDLILSYIPNKFSKVILQFVPDCFLDTPFEALEATPECSFMISQSFDLPGSHFRYPEPQRC